MNNTHTGTGLKNEDLLHEVQNQELSTGLTKIVDDLVDSKYYWMRRCVAAEALLGMPTDSDTYPFAYDLWLDLKAKE